MERDPIHHDAVERATDIFRALSNPVRVAIVRELAHGERAVHELVEALSVPSPASPSISRPCAGPGSSSGSARDAR